MALFFAFSQKHLAMKWYALLLIVILTATTSCKKDSFMLELAPTDYLIFGEYFGECIGNCVTLYKIEDGQLYLDDVDYGPPTEIPFLEAPLAPEKYEAARNIVDFFPNELLQSDRRRYGCPDCHDQGGIYLELFQEGQRHIWFIDPEDQEQSWAIINFKERLLLIYDELK